MRGLHFQAHLRASFFGKPLNATLALPLASLRPAGAGMWWRFEGVGFVTARVLIVDDIPTNVRLLRSAAGG